jgi:Fur family transcriptional regulator, ferric uptake regulator
MNSNTKKLRQTDARRIILEEIMNLDSHPTADEVYEIVRKRLPRVSLGTIYRNLDILSGKGLIQKLEVGGAQRRFDGNTGNHYHLRCLACGQVMDLTTKPLKEIEKTISQLADWEILDHRLELIGICLSCKPIRSRDNLSPAKLEESIETTKKVA